MKAFPWLFLLGLAAPLAGAQNTQVCAGCHGAKGEGNAQAGAPRIAGQPQDYLERQLRAYVEGSRSHPVMGPIAKGLNDAQRKSLAQFYARLDAPAPAAPKAAEKSARGAALAGQGDERLRVQACGNCHGPAGRGEYPELPYLAGLDSKYLQAAMAEWKSGARNTDPSGQMQAIAKALSEADVAALASFYASQRPPKAPAESLAAARKDGKAGGGASTAGTAATGPQGVGSEQGSPTAGGSQGPGGAGGR